MRDASCLETSLGNNRGTSAPYWPTRCPEGRGIHGVVRASGVHGAHPAQRAASGGWIDQEGGPLVYALESEELLQRSFDFHVPKASSFPQPPRAEPNQIPHG